MYVLLSFFNVFLNAQYLALSQLRFASGSLTQYLSVKYSEKLGSSSTVDDVEGTLAGFIPSGINYFIFSLFFTFHKIRQTITKMKELFRNAWQKRRFPSSRQDSSFQVILDLRLLLHTKGKGREWKECKIWIQEV